MKITEQQIESAAHENEDNCMARLGFIAGAEWALAQDAWISVEDQLPPVDPEDKNWSVGAIVYQGARQEMGTANYNFDNKRWCIANFMSSDGNQVTHWKPLPEPPTRKEIKK